METEEFDLSAGTATERATRIDLQKRAFLDDLGDFAGESFSLEAGLIVQFFQSESANKEALALQTMAAR